jgi:5'-3' exonuclease
MSQHLTPDVDGKRMATGGIFTFIKMVQRIEREYLDKEGRIYFLFDNPSHKGEHRKEIDPDYKINQKKRNPQFYRGLDYLQLVLMHYQTGYRIVRKPLSESDDLITPIMESFEDKQYTVLLVSNNMNWSFMINDTTHWMIRKNNRDVIYNKDIFYEEYGFYPGLNEVCLYKAIRGDIDDNIPPGVKNIPEAIVLGIIHQVKSVSNMFLHLVDLDIPTQWKESIRQNRGRIQLNFMLVDHQPITRADYRECTSITEFNKEMLSMLYRMLNFNPECIDERLRKPDSFVKGEDFLRILKCTLAQNRELLCYAVGL